MIPLGDLSGPLLSFGREPWLRVAGVLAALCGMAATAYVLTSAPVPAALRTPLAAVSILTAALGWAITMLRNTLDIDLDTRTWRHEAGLFVCRPSAGSLDDFTVAAVARRQNSNLYGEEEMRWTLQLRGEATLTVFRGWSDPAAADLAERIAARAGLRLQEEPAAVRSPGGANLPQRIITWAAWGAMACLIVTMAIPVVRGVAAGRTPVVFAQIDPERRAFRDGQEAFFGQKDYKTAELELRKVVKLNPRSSDARNLLAYALAEQNKMDDALDQANQALAVDPYDGNIVDTVAEMHQRRHEWGEAAKWFEKALYQQPGNGVAETHVKFAETLAEMGNIPEALRHLHAADGRATEVWADRARALRARIAPPTILFP